MGIEQEKRINKSEVEGERRKGRPKVGKMKWKRPWIAV